MKIWLYHYQGGIKWSYSEKLLWALIPSSEKISFQIYPVIDSTGRIDVKNTLSFYFISSMKEKRGYSAAAHHEKKGFLITGGYRNGPMSSTEITKDGVTFEYFTPLPIGVINHCAVALNDEEDGDFFVGSGSIPGSPGIPSSYSKRAFIHKGGKWNEMTQMVHARSGKKPSLEMRMI